VHICVIKPGKISSVAMKKYWLLGKEQSPSKGVLFLMNALSNTLCPCVGAHVSSCSSESYLEAECRAGWIKQLPHSFQKVIVTTTIRCSVCCKCKVQ